MPANLQKTLDEIKEEFPTFTLIKKNDSKLMKTVGFLLLVISFGKDTGFMEHFTTTLGTTVYTSTLWDTYDEAVKVGLLLHEREHMRQERAFGRFFYSLLYLFSPMPFAYAKRRTEFEMKGYETQIRYYHSQSIDITSPQLRQSITGYFIGPAYGWMMSADKDFVYSWYDNLIKDILAGK